MISILDAWRILNAPPEEEWKYQDTSIFTIEALFFVSFLKVGIKFSKKLPYCK